jgi:hypothetical protein
MKKTAGILIILAIIGGVFWTYKSGAFSSVMQKENQSAASNEQVDTEAALGNLMGSQLSESYESSDYGFSLKYPSELKMTPIDGGDSGSDVLLFQQDGTGYGFQIAISSYDDAGDVTAERIKADIPDMMVKDPEPVNLGARGKGVTFLDGDGADVSRQIWFAGGGYLFQITSAPQFDPIMQKILATWQFTK